MFQWLKLHFIPHEGNGHRPLILHEKNAHRIIGFVFFIEVFAFLIPTIALISRADTGNITPEVLSTLINNERAQYSLQPLTVNSLLNEAAQAKANDMAANSYFAHTSPDGKTPWYWFDKVGYYYSSAGENLAVDFTNANDVTAAWMNSPTHRENILKANYTQVGTGVASGMYQGYPAIFVAQDFAHPAAVPAQTVSTPITSASNSTVHVLGAESTTKTKPSKLVSKPAVVAIAPAVAPVVPVVSVEPAAPAQQSNLFQRMFASPRTTTNIILGIIFGIVALAVFLNIGIKISHHHPDLILNGVMVVAIIGCTFAINHYIAKANAMQTQTIDFTAEHTIL
ncbi:MAG TPA: CAP domain-containing protein [Candidatus Paceibacterota bacterium]|nr:CAP domain-containing protein [Candidatus Paceibacterota bacterium]